MKQRNPNRPGLVVRVLAFGACAASWSFANAEQGSQASTPSTATPATATPIAKPAEAAFAWNGLWQLTSAIWHPLAPPYAADAPKDDKPDREFMMRSAFDGVIFVLIGADGGATVEALGQKFEFTWTSDEAGCLLTPKAIDKEQKEAIEMLFGSGLRLTRLSDTVVRAAPIGKEEPRFQEALSQSFLRRIVSEKPILIEALEGNWTAAMEPSYAERRAWQEELLDSWIKRGHKRYEQVRDDLRKQPPSHGAMSQEQYKDVTFQIKGDVVTMIGPAPQGQQLATGKVVAKPGIGSLLLLEWTSEGKSPGNTMSLPIIARGDLLIMNPHSERVLVLQKQPAKLP